MTTEGSQLLPHARPGNPLLYLPPRPPARLLPGSGDQTAQRAARAPPGTLGGARAGKTVAENVGDARGEAPRAHSPRQLLAPGTLRCYRNISIATPAPGESLRLTACKASPHLSFIYESRFPQTSSNLHRWPLTPRSKNTKACDSGPPFFSGQMCCCAFGGRSACTLSSYVLTPAGVLAGSTQAPQGAFLEGCLRCLGLWSVWGSGGVLE